MSKYQALPNFVVRSPLLSYEDVRSHFEGAAQKPSLVDHPDILAAMRISNLSFLEKLTHLDKDPSLAITLDKYLLRISGRPMAFGMFAGMCVGTIGRTDQVILSDVKEHRLSIGLDAGAERAVFSTFVLDDQTMERISYSLNPSCEITDNKLSLLANTSELGRVQTRIYHIEPDIVRLMEQLRTPKLGRTIRSLVRAHSAPEFAEWMRYLLREKILVHQGSRRVPMTNKIGSLDKGLLTALKGCQDQPLKNSTPREILSRDLHQKFELKETETLLNVDLLKQTVKCELSQKSIHKIVSATHLLLDMFKGRTSLSNSKSKCNEFKMEFEDRYGLREISFFEAIRLYCDPVVRDFPSSGTMKSDIDQYLFRYVNEQGGFNKNKIILDADLINKICQFDELINPDYVDPKSLLAVCEMTEEPSSKVHIQYILSGPTPKYFTKFAAHENVFRNYAKVLVDEEIQQNRDKILAEIQYEPDHKASANVCFSTGLYPFSLTINCMGNPEQKNIPLTDLLVSVRNNRVVLRSAHYDQEVVPAISNLYNFSLSGHPTMEFLSQIGSQNSFLSLSWSWGQLREAAHLPRVEYRDCILVPELWHFRVSDKILNRRHFGRDIRVEKIREKFQLPRYVKIIDGDQKLPIDLENDRMKKIFMKRFFDDRPLELEECLSPIFKSEFNSLVRDERGLPFAYQVIVPLFQKPSDIERNSFSAIYRSKPADEKARTLRHGEQCLYFKIYLNQDNVIHLLQDKILSLKDYFLKNDLHWFFVRYCDPKFHIRLRVFGPRGKLAMAQKKLQEAIASWMQDSIIYRWAQTDYEREIERYGGAKSCEIFEKLSCSDSLRFVTALKARPKDILLSDWNFVYSHLSDRYLRDIFRAAKSEIRQLLNVRHRPRAAESEKQRIMRSHINSQWIRFERDLNDPLNAQVGWIRQLSTIFSEEFKKGEDTRNLKRWLALQDPSRRQSSAFVFYSDLLHMSLNRSYFYLTPNEEFAIYSTINRLQNEAKHFKKKPSLKKQRQ
jgi:thiopeptide-type bacteriocin biosynthesis protein